MRNRGIEKMIRTLSVILTASLMLGAIPAAGGEVQKTPYIAQTVCDGLREITPGDGHELPETVMQTEEPAEIPQELTYSEEDLEYLAIAIYCEGGGNETCDECRYRIGDVILNRVSDNRYPDTIEAVLTQKSQYGRFYWTGIIWPSRAQYEPEAVQRAYDTALDLLTDERHSGLYGEGYIYQAEFKQGKDIIECCGNYFGR